MILHPLIAKVFKSETTSFPYFTPKDFENYKKFGHWTLGSGGKKTKEDQKSHDSEAKFAKNQFFFCTAILHPL